VEILTLFITAVNKITNSTNEWANSLSKIGAVLAIFRVAKAIFNSFATKLSQFFVNTGVQIGENIIAGMKSKE
jgi:hypothetical protein